MKKSITVILIVIIAIGVACIFYKRYRIPPAIDLPVMALTDLQGHKVSLQSYSGHPLFLNFFATWCGPCMRELPDLADLKTKLADDHLQIICICDEPVEKLQNLQAKLGDRLVILHSDMAFHDMGIYTYPTNYIYNAQGQKVYDKVNPDDWDSPEVISKVRQLIQ